MGLAKALYDKYLLVGKIQKVVDSLTVTPMYSWKMVTLENFYTACTKLRATVADPGSIGGKVRETTREQTRGTHYRPFQFNLS